MSRRLFTDRTRPVAVPERLDAALVRLGATE
jgi:hypothetical protein